MGNQANHIGFLLPAAFIMFNFFSSPKIFLFSSFCKISYRLWPFFKSRFPSRTKQKGSSKDEEDLCRPKKVRWKSNQKCWSIKHRCNYMQISDQSQFINYANYRSLKLRTCCCLIYISKVDDLNNCNSKTADGKKSRQHHPPTFETSARNKSRNICAG